MVKVLAFLIRKAVALLASDSRDWGEQMEELSKQAPFKRNLSVGWSIFWRLWLPLLVFQMVVGRPSGWLMAWVGIIIFVGLPLANWAGKAVALKRYHVAIPSFIGWSIWWRGVVCAWILLPVSMAISEVTSSPSPNLLLLLVPFFCIYSGFFILYLLALGSVTHSFILDNIPSWQKIEMGFGKFPQKFPKNKERYLK